MRLLRGAFLLLIMLVPAHEPAAQTAGLGSVSFPNSGARRAQPAFLRGLALLHSFEYDDAAEAFREAQRLDPGFALAYWGEALTYDHPIWGEHDSTAARAALARLADAPEARIARGKTPREQAYLAAVEALYGVGALEARYRAFEAAMGRVQERFPDDLDAAALHALSLLTIRPRGTTDLRTTVRAAAICEAVLRRNPTHPGATHYLIHAYDDPVLAPLGLPVARRYARIAPRAEHALHMPSHIFVQRGMWEDVRKSNIAAYKSATELNARMKLAEGREDFHTLGWLEYANLMLGNIDEAKANVESAKQAADRNPGNAGIRNGYLGMRARLILETEQWEKIALDAPAAPAAADAHAGMPGMAMPAGNNTWTFIAGYSAAKLGDLPAAEKAVAMLRAAREKLEAGANPYSAKPVAIMEQQVAALVSNARGQKDAALKLAKDAMDIELNLSPPSGPPDPIKPAPEFYGELLLDAGRTTEAIAALELSLQRTPNRTPSVKAMAKARAAGTAMR